MRVCAFSGHPTDHIQGRGLCTRHYRIALRNGTLDNYTKRDHLRWWLGQPPLVCLCADSTADPAVNFGECPSCHRKPIRLLAASVFH